MSDEIKVYKVKDQTSGLYRTAGGGWSKTGKTWNNLGHLKNSLGTASWSRNSDKTLPDRDVVIIEIIVKETVGNTTVLADFIEKERRFNDLADKYGSSFSDLIKRIEKDDQQDAWSWLLLVPFKHNKSAAWEESFMMQLRDSKLKMNKDYRKANTRGLAVAFKDRKAAMLFRLALPTDVPIVSLDIQNFVETDVDVEDISDV